VRALGRATLLVAVLVLAGCDAGPAPSRSPASARPRVVATFFPLYDFTRQVAGDRAEVISLVPAGVEPHDWEPSPRDVADVGKAALLVYNGAGFEPSVDRMLREIGARGPLAIDTTAGLPLLDARDAAGRAGERAPGPASGGAKDPHVWLDPVLAQRQVDAIAAGLARVDAAGQAGYQERAGRYKAALAALHEAFAAGLASCARREVVTSHAAFGYLTRRYGLVQVPVIGMAPSAEPSPADLARLVRVARASGVQAVFYEPLTSPKLAETLAREVGARTLVLNPVEGLTAEEAAAGKDYVALMRANLESLRAGLGCR
jgi:zinc transport system substrate-binding protein